jgi:hypothetical protein
LPLASASCKDISGTSVVVVRLIAEGEPHPQPADTVNTESNTNTVTNKIFNTLTKRPLAL